MLKPLVRLTALAVDGWTAASVAQNLSCVSHLSELRSLAIQNDFVQVRLRLSGTVATWLAGRLWWPSGHMLRSQLTVCSHSYAESSTRVLFRGCPGASAT